MNRRYAAAPGGAFSAAASAPVWNQSERRWIGWERKRGKLHELNNLTAARRHRTFVATGGRAAGSAPCAPSTPTPIRLPRDTVRRLRGDGHPLNRTFRHHVRSRHRGLRRAAPRVTPSLPVGREGSFSYFEHERHRSYASTISDVVRICSRRLLRQQGIYDVDAFEQALRAGSGLDAAEP